MLGKGSADSTAQPSPGSAWLSHSFMAGMALVVRRCRESKEAGLHRGGASTGLGDKTVEGVRARWDSGPS